MRNRIRIIGGVVVAGLVIAGAFVANLGSGGVTLDNPQQIIWNKPTTDAGWAKDVKKESLNIRFDYQLTDMKVSLEKKLPLHEANLDKITKCPDCIRWELREQFIQMFEYAEIDLNNTLEGKTLQQWIDGEFDEQFVNKTWEVEKVRQSIERIDNEIRLREKGAVNRKDAQLKMTPSTQRERVEQTNLRNQ